MMDQIAKSGSEAESVTSAPKEFSRRALEVGIRFEAQVVADTVEKEKDRPGWKKALVRLEGFLEEPGQDRQSEQRSPQIAVVLAFQGKPKETPGDRVEQESKSEEQGKAYRCSLRN